MGCGRQFAEGVTMNSISILFSIVKADFLERTRRSSFLVTLCMIVYLGYAVNSGQILIKLGVYRGVYNSAWVGSLMAIVVTFFLGLTGFFLVKNTIERDEHSGVGQILAATSLTRPQYMLGKWLSNFAVLASLVVILALAAILMQVIQREDA
jgi:ABC-type transport system involved in multi-copper enzyme maturation permease subunit